MKTVVVIPGLPPDAGEAELRADAQRRRELDEAGIPYQVAYPPCEGPSTPQRPDYAWTCDKCSDPDCEHRLFTRLARDR